MVHCERDRVAAVVAHDALRLPGRARRVEDVERIGRLDRRRSRPARRAATASSQSRSRPRSSSASSIGRCRTTQRSGFDSTMSIAASSSGLYGDDAPGLDPARRRDDDLRPGVVDPARELVRREAAEDDRVDRAEPRAREHGDHRLGHHRHVDDHAIAALDAQRASAPGEARDASRSSRIGEGRVVSVTGQS